MVGLSALWEDIYLQLRAAPTRQCGRWLQPPCMFARYFHIAQSGGLAGNKSCLQKQRVLCVKKSWSPHLIALERDHTVCICVISKKLGTMIKNLLVCTGRLEVQCLFAYIYYRFFMKLITLLACIGGALKRPWGHASSPSRSRPQGLASPWTPLELLPQ